MNAEWDPAKARKNRRKHGVSFADAEGVLSDSMAITIDDIDAEGEQRFVTIGRDYLAQVLVVIFTQRGDNIRIISARKASPGERAEYEGEQ